MPIHMYVNVLFTEWKETLTGKPSPCGFNILYTDVGTFVSPDTYWEKSPYGWELHCTLKGRGQ